MNARLINLLAEVAESGEFQQAGKRVVFLCIFVMIGIGAFIWWLRR